MSFSPPLLLPLPGQVSVTVTRAQGGSYVKGVWVANQGVDFIIKANIQPIAKSTDTLNVPEGERSKETIKVYTTTSLVSRKEGDNPVEGDIIHWEGKLFEVRKVSEYKMGILNHTKAIAVRKEIT